MHGKHSLLIIAALAIGIFALPSTMSLFAGQHVWYDLTPEGNNVPCEKCHADVKDELISSGVHEDISCDGCHRTDQGVGGYAEGSGTGSDPGKGAHAASTEECMVCHGAHNFTHDYLDRTYDTSTCSQCHRGEIILAAAAGGFNITNNPDDTGSNAAHLKFVEDAINETTLKGANEACLACHTMIGVKINWTHARSLEFDVDIGEPLITPIGVHNWSMSNWATNGSASATVWGNTTGAGSTSYWDEWPGKVDNIYS
jgi:hypothetical protein